MGLLSGRLTMVLDHYTTAVGLPATPGTTRTGSLPVTALPLRLCRVKAVMP